LCVQQSTSEFHSQPEVCLNRKLRPLIFKSIIERIFLPPELAGLLLKFKQCLKVAKVKGTNAINQFCNSCISRLLTAGTLLSVTIVARILPYTLHITVLRAVNISSAIFNYMASSFVFGATAPSGVGPPQ